MPQRPMPSRDPRPSGPDAAGERLLQTVLVAIVALAALSATVAASLAWVAP